MLDRPPPYIPQTVGEVIDHASMMVLASPKFSGDGYLYAHRTVESEFAILNQGLARIKGKLGLERYAAARNLSDRARALFEADQDDVNGKTTGGKRLMVELVNLLTEPKPKKV